MNLSKLYVWLGMSILIGCGSITSPLDRSLLSQEKSIMTSRQPHLTTKKVERSAPKKMSLKHVAMLQLKSRAGFNESDVLFLTDTMRQAGALLDSSRFLLMTRENINTLLPPGSELEECEASCEIQLGRMLGAHYIVTGELVRFGEALRAQLRLHNSESGALLSSTSAKGKQAELFELSLGEATMKLLSTIDEGMKEKTFPRPVEVGSTIPQANISQTDPAHPTSHPVPSSTQTSKTSLINPQNDHHDWVLIYGEGFSMGSDKGEQDERPQRFMMVNDLLVTRSEVTVAQYQECVQAKACSEPRFVSPHCTWKMKGSSHHPINCVTWQQARDYAQWVGGDLPSEVQWEFIASSRGQKSPYPWGQSTSKSSLSQSLASSTAPVCSHPKGHSTQGVCDLAGNLWEWTLDEYAPYDQAHSTDSPHCSITGCMGPSSRVVRGGGWRFGGQTLKVTTRSVKSKSDAFDDLGFRVVKPVSH